MASILIYSDNSSLAGELYTAALNLAGSDEVSALQIGKDENAVTVSPCAKTYFVEQQADISDVAATATTIANVAKKIDAKLVLLSSDRRGKELAGRLGQRMQCSVITNADSVRVDGDNVLVSRNALGGAIVEEVSSKTDCSVIAISPKGYESAQGEEHAPMILDVETGSSTVSVVERSAKDQKNSDISSADILFVCGLGFEDESNVTKVKQLAGEMNAGCACTKPLATDKKWFSEDEIVGISGKTCKPSLAILLGVSGQVQFWAGIRDAKVVVAVNNDENAAIMGMSDYSFVGDVEDVVSGLKAKLV
ncbi:electron transfer flavoprotein subunit alpha/FixB family protein [Slackia isoflavoniconvertens]|uniref:electron transfer flavoprotein subunit alpha/FixB family protein n=1 Tax=Slackia isoflavoniconvertens TaxID=572010 RepID=UPI002E79BE06|nr:electron transfer flavoprotein subunit alpha/FixB family protein [Slackia isoflavoniconvertens]